MADPQETYPEPVEQCNICRWWQECDKRRRADDHLSLIASIRKIHISELNKNNVNKLEQFAKLDKPLPGKPERGHLDSYIKVHEQAKIQLKGKGLEKPIYDLLPFQEKKGFNRLPVPSDGDVYFDLSSAPFIIDATHRVIKTDDFVLAESSKQLETVEVTATRSTMTTSQKCTWFKINMLK